MFVIYSYIMFMFNYLRVNFSDILWFLFLILGFGFILQVSVIDEGRDMWKVYLDLKVYAAALANCRDPLQRDQVYLVQVIFDVLYQVNRMMLLVPYCRICNLSSYITVAIL